MENVQKPAAKKKAPAKNPKDQQRPPRRGLSSTASVAGEDDNETVPMEDPIQGGERMENDQKPATKKKSSTKKPEDQQRPPRSGLSSTASVAEEDVNKEVLMEVTTNRHGSAHNPAARVMNADNKNAKKDGTVGGAEEMSKLQTSIVSFIPVCDAYCKEHFNSNMKTKAYSAKKLEPSDVLPVIEKLREALTKKTKKGNNKSAEVGAIDRLVLAAGAGAMFTERLSKEVGALKKTNVELKNKLNAENPINVDQEQHKKEEEKASFQRLFFNNKELDWHQPKLKDVSEDQKAGLLEALGDWREKHFTYHCGIFEKYLKEDTYWNLSYKVGGKESSIRKRSGNKTKALKKECEVVDVLGKKKNKMLMKFLEIVEKEGIPDPGPNAGPSNDGTHAPFYAQFKELMACVTIMRFRQPEKHKAKHGTSDVYDDQMEGIYKHNTSRSTRATRGILTKRAMTQIPMRDIALVLTHLNIFLHLPEKARREKKGERTRAADVEVYPSFPPTKSKDEVDEDALYQFYLGKVKTHRTKTNTDKYDIDFILYENPAAQMEKATDVLLGGTAVKCQKAGTLSDSQLRGLSNAEGNEGNQNQGGSDDDADSSDEESIRTGKSGRSSNSRSRIVESSGEEEEFTG